MSASILPPGSMLPVRRARLPWLPVLAVAALLLGLLTQAFMPVSTPLPEVAPSRARALPAATARLRPSIADPVIAARTLFAPARHYSPAAAAAGGAAVKVPADALSGSMLVGTASARGFAVAVIRDATGHVRSLRVGERLGTWRVLAIGHDFAMFGSGATRRRLGVGETAPVQPSPAQTSAQVENP